MATTVLHEAWLRETIDSHLAVVVRADTVEDGISQLPLGTRIVAIGDPESTEAGADHVINRAWPTEAINALLAALSSRHRFVPPVLPAPSTPADAASVQRAVAATRRLAAAMNLATWEAITVDVLMEMLDLDRAHCLYYDEAEGSLWSEALHSGPTGDERRAITGLVGFAARTGAALVVQHASEDPRFAPAIDDPLGDPTDQLIVQPVQGADGAIHAVLIGVRRAHRPRFEPTEIALFERFARLASPTLEQLAIHDQAQAILDEQARTEQLFRSEAIQAQLQPRWGDVIRVSPRWLPWANRALGVLLMATIVLVAVSTVSTYSAGPAVIRSLARTPVIARTAGNILSVDVMPGFRVSAGTVIARLDDTDQREIVARLEREHEMQLRNHMLDPRDSDADALLRNVRDQLELARIAMGERLIRATTGGVIGDIRMRAGQHVEHGDLVATVLDTVQGLEVIALLPGEDRPQLAPGMMLRLELSGRRYAYQSVVIDSVSPDVISPTEARRVLGSEVANDIAIGGPVTLVRGRLPSAEFTVDGQTLAYHDGMWGIAEVRVGVEPTAFALIPGMQRLR